MAAFGEESRPERLTATKTLTRRLAHPAIVEATFTPYFKLFLDHEDKLPANENLSEFGRAVNFVATSATEEPAPQRRTRTETLHGPHWTREPADHVRCNRIAVHGGAAVRTILSCTFATKIDKPSRHAQVLSKYPGVSCQCSLLLDNSNKQQEAAAVEIWYTLPVLPTGLTAAGLGVVESALDAGVDLDGVNVMAMDYGESAAPTSGPNAHTMGEYAIRAGDSTYDQLSLLYAGYGLASNGISWVSRR